MLGRRTCSIALAALVLTGACSSGGSDPKAGSGRTTSTLASKAVEKSVTTTTSPAAKVTAKSDQAFCDTFGRMQAIELSGPGTDPDAIRAHYQKILDLAPALKKASPASLADNVAIAARITGEVVDTGSTAPFETDVSKKNGAKLAEYARTRCATK